ncbi:MAG: cox cluster protein [Halorientalis sp.]
MDDDPGLDTGYRRGSPWPVFVALGLALSEVGIFVGVFALAVGGLLLFAGSVAGILTESGHVAGLWTPLAGFGAALVAVGTLLVVSQVGVDPASVLAALASPATGSGIVSRAGAIAVAGVILVAAGGTGRLLGGGPLEA